MIRIGELQPLGDRRFDAAARRHAWRRPGSLAGMPRVRMASAIGTALLEGGFAVAGGRAPGQKRADAGGRRGHNVLTALGPEARAELLKHSEQLRVARGIVLFSQGETHRTTYFVLKGLIKTYYLSPSGKAMTLAYWSEGDMVGGPDFFTDSAHIWSAAAVKDSTVLAIDGSVLDRLVAGFPDLAQYIIRALTFKVEWLSGLLQITCTESVTDRLAHLLVKLGEMYGTRTDKGVVINEDISQEELANMVGASRQWVNLTLKRLARAHLISVVGRRIVLRDPERLKQTGLIALNGDEGR